MSHTPLDGPDGGSRDGAESTEEASADGFLGRIRRALGRVGETLHRVVATAGPPERRDDEPDAGRGPGTRQSVPLTDGDGRRERPVLADPPDNRPVAKETAREPRDRPELVARWNDGRLTLSEPDEAGAQISSDTWSEVDP